MRKIFQQLDKDLEKTSVDLNKLVDKEIRPLFQNHLNDESYNQSNYKEYNQEEYCVYENINQFPNYHNNNYQYNTQFQINGPFQYYQYQ